MFGRFQAYLPPLVNFGDLDWREIGTKMNLKIKIFEITGIPIRLPYRRVYRRSRWWSKDVMGFNVKSDINKDLAYCFLSLLISIWHYSMKKIRRLPISSSIAVDTQPLNF
jgi:hypothetical protein